MLDRKQFQLLWPPVLLVFQLLGYTTYASKAKCRLDLIRRLVYPIGFLVIMCTLSLYVILTKVSLHADAQINAMSDQTIYLSILTAQLVTLSESLCKRDCSEQLFKQLHEIAAELCSIGCATNHPAEILTVDFVRVRRGMLLKNWLQLIGLAVNLAIGIALTGIQSWFYFRWIVLAELLISVRLMECAMHVELIGELLDVVEQLIASAADDDATILIGPRKRYSTILRCAINAYSRIHGQAERISGFFGWSLLAIFVYAMNGMVNAAFWFVYASYTGAVKM